MTKVLEHAADHLRSAIVLGCAMALICAGM
jgi:hypothetical protein